MQPENAEPEVITSAPPIDGIPAHADLEDTWTGGENETELDALRRRAAFFERRAEDAEQRALAEKARADAAESAARVHAEAHRGALAALEEARARIEKIGRAHV